MIENGEQPIRGFHWCTKAWYWYWNMGLNEKPTITFGMYYKNDGTPGEMSMKWHNLKGSTLIPKLEVFDDSWKVLASFTDVIQKLGEHDDENITEEQFVQILLECGFTDLTKY